MRDQEYNIKDMSNYKNRREREYHKVLSAKLSNTLKVMGVVREHTAPRITGSLNLTDEQLRSFFDVLAGLQELNFKQRVCWLANKLGGMSSREIADVLGISFKNVGKHVKKANKILTGL